MRFAWCAVLAIVSITQAQDDAAWLAWSGAGEAAGPARPTGSSQPAALAWERSTTVALSVVPAIYGVEALRSCSAGLTVGRDGLGYGLSLTALEAGAARRISARGVFGLALTSGLAIGLSGAVGQWTFPRYALRGEWEGGIGAQLRSDQVTTGILISARGQEGRPFTPEQVRVVMGGAVMLSESVAAIAEVVDGERLELQAGTRVTLLEALSFIVSWNDGTNCVGGACEITVDTWQALVSARWHPILGWTRGIMLSHLWR